MLRLCRSCIAAPAAPVSRRALATAASAALPPRRPRSHVTENGRRGSEPKPKASLTSILSTLTKYKAESRSPTPVAYISIIEAASDFALSHSVEGGEEQGLGFQVALAAWEDARRGGVELGQEGVDAMLSFATVYPKLLPSLLLYTKTRRNPSYQAMARTAASNYDFEQMIFLLNEMFQHGYQPKTATLKHTVQLACQWGHPRLALQLAMKAEAQSVTGFRLDQSAWIQILIASADNQYLHGVETAWERVKNGFTPDEGLILSILNTAGRWGRPDISSTMLELLPTSPEEHHLAPLLEAFCNAGEVPNAFQVLTTTFEAGITPTLNTVQPIVAVLRSTEVIDRAFYTLEDMHKAGKAVHISALNAVVAASAALGDLQRTRATQMAAADLGLTPNIDSYNLVLQCCLATEHRALGDTILSEMATQGLSPDVTTYELMVKLCLTQASYEDAFYYLEKMKAHGVKPSYDVYQAMVKKCVLQKDPRWRLLVDEIKLVGHKVEYGLQDFINYRGKSPVSRQRDESGQRRATDQMAGEKRRSWIKQVASEDQPVDQPSDNPGQ